jgi:lipoprotein-releasing system permease protein
MAIMSLVAVALIFVILYTIVMQKTREVGVLKAVGASSWGVATLFFIYGAIIGLIGSVVGIIAGVVTVSNINHIQDWADRMFGFRVWTKESFMFEEIPTEVDWNMAVYIVAGSILAGLIGALVPAIRAGRMQPVEALRYE